MRSLADMERFVTAIAAKDVDGVVACLAADAELRSPITRRIVFRGREQIREVLEVVYAALEDNRVEAVIGDGDERVLLVSSRLGGQPLDETMVVRQNAAGEITSMRLYVRTMPQLVSLAAVVGPPLARRRSRVRALAIRALFTPVAALVRHGEPVAVALTGAGTPERGA